MELVGFVGGAIDNNVITQEFSRLKRNHVEVEIIEENSGKVDNAAPNVLPDTAEHLLLFIFST